MAEKVKSRAIELGFAAAGIAAAQESPHWLTFKSWVDEGYAGEMAYIPQRLEAYRHPEGVLPGCQSIIVLAAPYRPSSPDPLPLGAGRVAAYAASRDYHQVLRQQLRELAITVQNVFPDSRVRTALDTAPLLERSFAVLAGLGWLGKNCMLIHPRFGSYLLLGEVLTTAKLQPDSPFPGTHCGTCGACIEACPTGALVAPYLLDPRRCISYWTIEARGLAPRELRPLFGDWFFGCDVCQQVCPWNRKLFRAETPNAENSWLLPGPVPHIDACEVLAASDEQLRLRFRQLPLWRAKSSGLRRNAALVLGNALRKLSQDRRTGPPSTLDGRGVPAESVSQGEWATSTVETALRPGKPVEQWLSSLERALQDPHPVVRQVAAWALAGYPSGRIRSLLERHLVMETHPAVREEIEHALHFEL
ncbi:MAG: tRNA epoxyqueuosine(34) reductase QueG [Thermoguttaceae bacterium]|nr:tRNA epoxyqueuosine(34) reductase QueG [Thermoguttaceae bacterium]